MIYPGTALPLTSGQAYLNTACAAPQPQVLTFGATAAVP